MNEHVRALLVHGRTEPFESLKRTVRELSVETYTVATCQQAEKLIPRCSPDIIFTESSVADGSWISICNLAQAAELPPSVIVVGKIPDTQLYLAVMEGGAFDFVAPPFEHESLKFVIRSAVLNNHYRREALAHVAATSLTGWHAQPASGVQINRRVAGAKNFDSHRA